MVGAPPQPGAPQQGPGGTEIPPCWGARLTLAGGGGARLLPGYSLSPKELHPQKGKDDDEEEEEEEEADDGLHGVQEGDHQVPQGSPVPARAEPGCGAVGGPGPWGDKGMRRDMGVMRGHRDSEGTRDGNSAPRHPTMAPCIHTCLLVLALPLHSQTHRHGQTNGQTDGRMDRAAVPNPSALTL